MIKAVGRENIKVKTFDGKALLNSELKNVLHVPELKCNLLSISSASDRGCTFKLRREDCKIKKNNSVIAIGKREKKLYKLILKID